MVLEEEVENLKEEVERLKQVVRELTAALKVAVEDNEKAKEYISTVDKLISNL